MDLREATHVGDEQDARAIGGGAPHRIGDRGIRGGLREDLDRLWRASSPPHQLPTTVVIAGRHDPAVVGRRHHRSPRRVGRRERDRRHVGATAELQGRQ